MLSPTAPRAQSVAVAFGVTVVATVAFCLALMWVNPLVFWNDDYQISILPVLADVARSWREGHWPLLSPYSWACGNLAGEYQYGTFSVFVNAVIVAVWQWPLSFGQQAAALSITHLAVLAAGCFLLARQRRLSVALATMVGLAGALNGWEIGWGATNWFGALAAHAWLPWAWWAFELAMSPQGDPPQGWRRLRPLLPAPFVYLVLTGGFPYTVVMLALVSAWLAIQALSARRPAALVPLVTGWVFGLGLSAPAWLSLLAAMHGSGRAEGVGPGNHAWTVPLSALPGMILPNWTTYWRNFADAPGLHAALELTGAFVPVTGLIAGFVGVAGRSGRLLRACRWDLALLSAVLLLCLLPSPGVFRWSFRWLPLLHIVLALTGARAWEFLAVARAEPMSSGHWPAAFRHVPRLSGGAWACLLVAGTSLAMLLAGTGNPEASTRRLPVWMLGCTLGWVGLEAAWRRRSSYSAWLPAVMTWATLWIAYTHLPTNPGVPRYAFDAKLVQAAPLATDRLYLALYPEPEHADVVGTATPERAALLRPGSTNLFAGLRFINGYSPIMGAGIGRALRMKTHGEIPPDVAAPLLASGVTAGVDLRRLGVDGLIVARNYPLTAAPPAEWVPVSTTEDGTVYQRAGDPLPAVEARTAPADASGVGRPLPFPTVLENSRLQVIVDATSFPRGEEILLNFHRPYFPGYEALMDGAPLRVQNVDGFSPDIRIPPGEHRRLTLRYRPWAVTWGVRLAAVALAGWLLAAVWLWTRIGRAADIGNQLGKAVRAD